MLPPLVTLRISEDPKQFLSRMEEMLRGEPDIIVNSETYEVDFCGHSCVAFSPEPPPIDELVGRFVYWPEKAPEIEIGVTANWQEFPIDYDVYIDALKGLFAERLKAYNKLYKCRYRLRIPNKESSLPSLTPKLKERFLKFSTLANKTSLHQNDWHRFYQFVKASYRSQPDLSESDVRYHLQKAGFDSEQSDYIADAFNRCKDFYIQIDWKRRRAYGNK